MLVTKFAIGRTFFDYFEGRAMRLKTNYLNRGVIGGAILGTLAAVTYSVVYRQITKGKRLEKVVEVQRWEGEGGNVAPALVAANAAQSSTV